MKRMMVLDGNNAFLRHYIVNPAISTNGQPVGGIIGFLRGLQKLSRMMRPDMIVVVWDGEGGSRKRKSLVKTYKEGRRPARLNRNIRNLDDNQEAENAMWQQLRVVEYLNEMPVVQFVFQSVEADDVIAYVCGLPQYEEWEKIIVSSDKDFIQCCDQKTILYRPVQDQIMSEKSIVEEYGIHPLNFALARAIAGDKSDNLPGVPGIGLGSIAKRIPELKSSNELLLNELQDYCENKIEDGSKIKFFPSVLSHMQTVKLNYKVMQLYSPSLSITTSQAIKETMANHEPEFRQTQVIKMLFEDGFPQVNLDELYSCYNKIKRDFKEQKVDV